MESPAPVLPTPVLPVHTPLVQKPSLMEKFLTLCQCLITLTHIGTILLPKEKLNDMGSIGEAHFICADFGGTLFKVCDGKEKKFKHENYVILLSTPDGRKELIDFMLKHADTWPKNVRITVGSLLKNDPEGMNERNIKLLISEFNEMCKTSQIIGIEIENAVTNVLGRLYKAALSRKIKVGDMLILGGPFWYANDIKFTSNGMEYTSREVRTTANPNSKMGFKFYYYFVALLNLPIDLKRHTILVGPTGSNPTITLVDLPSSKMTVYEFPTLNFDKSKENGGWSGTPEPSKVTEVDIPIETKDKFDI